MPTLLDAFGGAAVGADGYADAGFDVFVLDKEPQPDCPYPFIQADALNVLRYWKDEFDFLHVSPPCQAHTRAAKLRDAQGGVSRYADLLSPTLRLLRRGLFDDVPWVCENVPDAKPLMVPQPGEYLITLCGSMFGLGVQRHRLFLSNMPLTVPGPCDHSTFELDPITGKPRPWGVYHVPNDSIPKGGRTVRDVAHGREVMGVTRDIPWAGLKEGIPPAYTEWIGRQLLSLTPVAH